MRCKSLLRALVALATAVRLLRSSAAQPLVVLILVVSSSALALEAGAEISIENPLLEPYRRWVEAAGIEYWPIAYRGHVLIVTMRYSASDGPLGCPGAAGAPSISWRLVYDDGQFELLDYEEEVEVEFYEGPDGVYASTTVSVIALLQVEPGADVFRVEDWSGFYSRERVYVVWTVAYTRLYPVEGGCEEYTVEETVEEFPEPEFMRLYARDPRALGIAVWPELRAPGTACSWGDIEGLWLRLLNPALGLPLPGDDPERWQEVARIRPGALVLEGFRLEARALDARGEEVASLEYTGRLPAVESESRAQRLELRVDPEAWAWSLRITVEARAVEDDPETGAAREVVVLRDGSLRARLPLTWLVIEAPEWVSVTVDGEPVSGPWPRKICVEPGEHVISWQLGSKVIGVYQPRIVVLEPPEPKEPEEGSGVEGAPRLALILALMLAVTLLLPLRLLISR